VADKGADDEVEDDVEAEEEAGGTFCVVVVIGGVCVCVVVVGFCCSLRAVTTDVEPFSCEENQRA
jgi:hypothetical protein